MIATTKPSASFWLAAALVTMPFLQWLPVDFDRTGVLCLLLPFLWAERNLPGPALVRVAQRSRWLGWSMAGFFAATFVSLFTAGQFAPACVTAACWVLLAAAALIAGELIVREPATGPRLLGAVALGVTAGTMIVWILWWLGGRGMVPLYAHHRIFGLHMIGGSVAAVGLIVHFWKQPARRNAWFVVGIVNWAGLLWSGGRGPVLALLLALVAWWVTGDSALRRRLTLAGAGLLAGGLLLSLAMWTPRPELGWWNALRRTTAANGGPALSVSAITSARSDFWRESFDRFELRPWFGHGADAYRYLTPKLDGQQPHNFILQLLLDVGATGTLAALIFIGALIWLGARRAFGERGGGATAPWLALAVASLIAGMLDGVFYHLVALLPATLALGVLATADAAEPAHSGQRRWKLVVGAAVIVAASVLALHTWIFHSLAAGPAPAPTAWRARMVRTFPSTTFGLWRWLDAWQAAEPDAALEWSRWAQAHSANPPALHIYTARLLLARGDRDGAVAELRAALAGAHRLNQPAIAEMLRSVESAPH